MFLKSYISQSAIIYKDKKNPHHKKSPFSECIFNGCLTLQTMDVEGADLS